jgi:hypothetical protein
VAVRIGRVTDRVAGPGPRSKKLTRRRCCGNGVSPRRRLGMAAAVQAKPRYRARFTSPSRADDSKDGGSRAAAGSAAETAFPQTATLVGTTPNPSRP